MRSVTTVGGAAILIVDDHPVVRRGLLALLQAEPWVGRVLEAATFAEGVELAVTQNPSAAVVDLGLPDGDGVELVRRVRRSAPDCAVLVLTMTSDDRVVRRCLESGAAGYVLKSTDPVMVVRAIQTVLEGGLVLGPGVASSALPGGPGELAFPLNQLSGVEVRLLALVADGRSNGQIATRLGVSEKTVRNRLSTVLTKIGAADRLQAALLARDKGLTLDHGERP